MSKFIIPLIGLLLIVSGCLGNQSEKSSKDTDIVYSLSVNPDPIIFNLKPESSNRGDNPAWNSVYIKNNGNKPNKVYVYLPNHTYLNQEGAVPYIQYWEGIGGFGYKVEKLTTDERDDQIIKTTNPLSTTIQPNEEKIFSFASMVITLPLGGFTRVSYPIGEYTRYGKICVIDDTIRKAEIDECLYSKEFSIIAKVEE